MSTSPAQADTKPQPRTSVAGEQEETKPMMKAEGGGAAPMPATAAGATEPTASVPVDSADAALLAVIDRFEGALAAKDIDAAMACVAPNVTWHADLVTLRRDIHGKDALRAYLKAFPDCYSFTHKPLGKCADGLAGFGFSWAIDVGVAPKPEGAHGDQAGDTPPSDSLSSTYFVFERPAEGTQPSSEGVPAAEPAGPLVADIFQQRTPTPDELVRKLGAPRTAWPKGARVLGDIPFEELTFNSASAHDAERAALHATAAEAINESWRTGSPEHALPHLSESVLFVNALTGVEKRGPDAWAAMLRSIFRRYQVLWHSSATCVTPGNKACVFFTAAAKYELSEEEGEEEGEGGEVGGGGPPVAAVPPPGGEVGGGDDEMEGGEAAGMEGGGPGPRAEFVQPSGQSLLLFDDDDKVKLMISFFTPLPGKMDRLFEAGEPMAEAGKAGPAEEGVGGKAEGMAAGAPATAKVEGAKPEETAAVKAAEA